MAGTTQATITRPTQTSEAVRQAAPTPAQRDGATRRLLAVSGPGTPMAPAVRLPLERSFGTRLDHVRVHTDNASAAQVQASGARALTYGAEIFLGPGESAADPVLLGHEAAHVVQQSTAPTVQPFAMGGGGLEREADAAAAASSSGNSFVVTGRTVAPTPQAQEGDKSIWQRGADLVGEVVQFGEAIGMKLVEEVSPELAGIMRKGPQGVLDWLKERLSEGVQAGFNTLMAPVRAVTGIGQQLSTEFAPLLAWARDAAGKIAKNDCSPFREAAEKIEQVAQSLIQPIVEKLQPVIAKTEQFFRDVWDTIGAPVWDWIKKYAASQWELVKKVAGWVWDAAQPIRKLASDAWTWFKNKLGIGEGPEGQNGILQWVQQKGEAIWSELKVKLAPFQKQITAVATAVGGILLMLSPAGPIIAVGALIYGVVEGVRWIKTNWGKGNATVQARVYLEKTLIPALLGNVHSMTASLVRMANTVATSLQQFAAKVGAIAGSVAGTLLDFAVAAVQWIAGQIDVIAEWATQKLLVLVDLVQAALSSLAAFMQRVLTFLGKVANVVIDIWSLPVGLLGAVWNAIPACVRDPFIDFIMPIILRQIEIFRELGKDAEAWQKTRADITNILRLVFVNRDLMGAVKATFQLLLRMFNVPVDLAARVWAKAVAAWDVVSAKPIEFIKNAARSIGRGFTLLWKNIRTHLSFGLEGWLLGEVAEKEIKLPKKWSDAGQVFDFVLSVLGLSMNHVFELLAKRFDPEKVKKLKVIYGMAKKVLDWVRESIDTSKSPAENTKGLVKQAGNFAATIFTGIVEWIIAKVAIEVAIMTAAAAASAGLSEVLDVLRRIYKAIQSAVRWANKILQMAERALDSVLEIANGLIDAAGARVEQVMHMGMPVVIGFLADQVGLGGVGQKIRDIIGDLRAAVDDALLWLIDALRAVFDAIVAGVSKVVKAVVDWWKKRFGFTTDDGETHTIIIDGDIDAPAISVQSARTALGELMGQIADDDEKKKARNKAAEVTVLIREGKAARSEKEINDQSAKIDKKLGELAAILVAAGVLDKKLPPVAKYSFDMSDGKADTAEVINLSSNRPLGSEPAGGSYSPQGWVFAQATHQTDGEPYYRQMHLINRLFGGPGIKQNLAPGPQSANSEHLKKAEDKIKDLVGDRPNTPGKTAVVFSYKVHVDYFGESKKLVFPGAPPGAPPARVSDFAQSFVCSWEWVDVWPRKRNTKTKSDGYTVPPAKFKKPRDS
jgi:hypothetical protein